MSNNSSDQIYVNNAVFISGYSIILGLGFVLNFAALCFFYRLPQLRSPTNVYMKNLAFADILLVCTLPLKIYDYTETQPTLPSRLCQVVGTLFLLNMYGSIFLLACISMDRCLAVCFPLRSKSFRHYAPWICASAWGLNIISCSMVHIFSNKETFENTSNNCCFHMRPSVLTRKSTTVLSVVIGFMVPLGIMAVSSWALLRAVGHSQLVQIGVVNKEKIVRMLVTNLAIFLLCFLPYHVILLCYQFLKTDLFNYYQITLLIACSNAVLDPIAYYFAAETIQRTVVKEMRLVGESDASAEKLRSSASLPPKGS
ncbi:lysophosphatidic acid receptor 6-like [Pelobates fuscus]|uniref:lysophosphatidic acid receptor 6-like n=1 Tax=Pelobates fuscus TaxID=191477 RepID=UPI002FE48C38